MPLIKDNIKKSFGFNLAVVLSLCVLLYIGFFASLHWFTRHGEETIIPSVKGKDVASAVSQLRKMHFDVYIDSTYEPAFKPLTILKQVPDSGSTVKQGRTVFLTVNMLTPPRIPMPNLVSLSYRSAEMLLKNNKLLVGDTISKPDFAAGSVLEQLYNGAPVRPGEMIQQGSKISLVIGNGRGNTEWDVPDVSGLSVDEARTILNQYNLVLTFSPKDQMSQISDTPSALIVDQSPRASDGAGKKNRIKMGDVIDLIIDQHPNPEDIHHESNTEAPEDVK